MCFELFDNELCLTYKPLAVVSGSHSASYCGKSTLIPFLFAGLHPEYSISRSKLNTHLHDNNVDVLCNDETCSKWIVADFHSRVHSRQAKYLLKSMLANASLHVLNVTLGDFENTTGDWTTAACDTRDIVDWTVKNTTATVVLLLRDFIVSMKTRLEAIDRKLKECYRLATGRVVLLTLENILDDRDANRPFRIKKLRIKSMRLRGLAIFIRSQCIQCVM